MDTPVIVVGSYVQDLTFYASAFPLPGETVLGSFVTGPGGKGSNQAVASQRAGAGTCFIGAVGKDAFAGVAKEFHKSEGIDARWLDTEKASTGAAAIIVNQQGENEIVVSLGACDFLTGVEVESRFPQEAEIVVTQLETNLEATRVALKRGKELGAMTVLNSAPMREDFSVDLLKDVDVLIPNETEFVSMLNALPDPSTEPYTEEQILNCEAAELHALCRKLGVSTVVVTLGARGAFLSTIDSYEAFLPLDGMRS
jgi:ribokinase